MLYGLHAMLYNASTTAPTPVTATPHPAHPLLYSISTWWKSFHDALRTASVTPVITPSKLNRNATPQAQEPRARAPLSPRRDQPPELPPCPEFVASYSHTLQTAWRCHDWSDVVTLVDTLYRCWQDNRQVFLCGNGGSAANAIHLANDFLYGVDKATGRGLRVIALPANAAVLTCLANDIAYEDIFAQQLTVLANRGDVLIVFSGSGNSPNIVKALIRARELGVTSFAILGFSGGRALELAEHPIYFPVHDMQVAEDLQMMVGHMAMQDLSRRGHPSAKA
jgi:D-sedoheptulose 7-phosphate isomerase